MDSCYGKSGQVNFCPGELILKLLTWIGKSHQNLSEKAEFVLREAYPSWNYFCWSFPSLSFYFYSMFSALMMWKELHLSHFTGWQNNMRESNLITFHLISTHKHMDLRVSSQYAET